MNITAFGNNFSLNKNDVVFFRNIKIDQDRNGNLRYTLDDLSEMK